MGPLFNSLKIAGLLTLMVGLSGCLHIDRLGSQMDMAANRLSEAGKPEFEGTVESVHVAGSMIAIQFAGGTYYDVVDAPPGLKRGDTVRIYKAEKGGLEAHVWKTAKETVPTIVIDAPRGPAHSL